MAIKKISKATKDQKTVKSVNDLMLELANKQKDLIDAKKGHRLGELTNTCVLKATRKDIARLHTAIRLADKKDMNAINKGKDK